MDQYDRDSKPHFEILIVVVLIRVFYEYNIIMTFLACAMIFDVYIVYKLLSYSTGIYFFRLLKSKKSRFREVLNFFFI